MWYNSPKIKHALAQTSNQNCFVSLFSHFMLRLCLRGPAWPFFMRCRSCHQCRCKLICPFWEPFRRNISENHPLPSSLQAFPSPKGHHALQEVPLKVAPKCCNSAIFAKQDFHAFVHQHFVWITEKNFFPLNLIVNGTQGGSIQHLLDQDIQTLEYRGEFLNWKTRKTLWLPY